MGAICKLHQPLATCITLGTAMTARPRLPNCQSLLSTLCCGLGLGVVATLLTVAGMVLAGPAAGTWVFVAALMACVRYGLATGTLDIMLVFAVAYYSVVALAGKITKIPILKLVGLIHSHLFARSGLIPSISALVAALLIQLTEMHTLSTTATRWWQDVNKPLRLPLHVTYCVTAARAPTARAMTPGLAADSLSF